MQNYGHLRPGEFRAPETEILPDGRKRLTRFFEVTHKSKIPKELEQGFNTLDLGETPIPGWDGLRLTDKKVTDMGSGQQGADARPVLQLTFEEIDETAETPVGGGADITRLEDGRSAFVLDWLQFAIDETGAFNPTTPRVVGSSLLIGTTTTYLLKEEAPDDGCLRRIKRTYVTEGIIATDLQTKENGALLIRTITSVVTVPATPGGFVLIGQPVQNPFGLPIYTYTYAKGNGLVLDSADLRNGGLLVIYHRTSLGVAPTMPTATIGGTVTPTGTAVRADTGYNVYDYTWAEGIGEIGRETRFGLSADGGLTGTKTVTIRYLSPLSTTTNPITPPDGMALISEEWADQDGYKLWTASYGSGTGTVSQSVDIREGGKLYIYHIAALNAAPTAPAPSIGGTVTLISTGLRQDAGHTIYEYSWAEGNGEISREIDYSQSVDQGASGLTRTTIRFLTALTVTTDPTALPGSINVGVSFVCQDGYKLWTSSYAKGTGTVDSRDSAREDGSIVYSRTTLSAAASTPATPAGSYLIDLNQSPSNGVFVNRATFIKPPATVTHRQTTKYPVPGLAYFVGTDLIMQPPTERFLLHLIEVSFSTTQDTTTPFTVITWGAMTEFYVPTASKQPVNKQWGLVGYLCTGVTLSGSGTYKGEPVDSYSVTRYASNPSTMPTGATLLDVNNQPYLAALDGTIVYKITKTSAVL